MAGDLILLTGSTGFLGFRTLLLALEAGYSVRAAVRSSGKANAILSHPLLKALNPGSRLTFVTVPDLLPAGAYDEAVKDVKFILHLASPVPDMRSTTPPENPEEDFIQPAIRSALGMLEAASKSPSVQRIVITSTAAANIALPYMAGLSPPPSTPFTASSRVTPFPEGPYPIDFAAYHAGKVACLAEAEAFVAREKPSFDVIHIHPSYVEGKNLLVTAGADNMRYDSNEHILSIVLGDNAKPALPGCCVFPGDVARMHVDALQPRIPGNRSYGATIDIRWEDVNVIVEREFRAAVESGVLPNNGQTKTLETKYDASETEELFGFKFVGFEEQVKSVVGHYLELKEAEGK